MPSFRLLAPTLLALATAALPAQTPTKRPLTPNDIYRVRDVSDPQLSPDGKWVAYTVSAMDSAKDKSVRHVWMTSWDGASTIQATTSKQSEHGPRWSPDNRYLAFLSSREGAKETQLWLLDRQGGEAVRISSLAGGISDYAWSPDGKRVVLVSEDPDPAAADTTAPPRPIVITRYHFKNDDEGYLENRHYHLYLLDLATHKVEQLTRGPFDEESPAWSPDGQSIAFVSNHDADPDRSENSDVFVMAATPGAPVRQLTTFPGPDNGDLAWSPDSKRIAYLCGSEPRFSAYSQDRVAVVSVDGGAPRILTAALDRPLQSLRWSSDGASVLGIVEDDRTRYLARVNPNDSAVQHVVDGQRVVSAFSQSANGELALLV
ncbi:MAG: LpqB family beta-propeller domain-containing protein, partial [Gemmatimonadaceae bacterium]